MLLIQLFLFSGLNGLNQQLQFVGNGNPLQYSWLENLRDRGAWWAAVYGVAQSQTWLKRLSSSGTRPSELPDNLKSPAIVQWECWMGETRSSHPSASLWKALNGKHKGGAEWELCRGVQFSPCMSWFPFLPSMPIDGTLTLDSDSQIHLGSQRWVSKKI